MGLAMFDTLTEPVICARGRDESTTTWTLPGVMAGLARGEIASFPALRPHQRHVWHAFLVQLATLALLKGGRSELPEGEDDWRELIRGLTPDWPDDEPWSLVVEDVSKPALLQPPVPRQEFAAWKKKEDNWCYTPDELDTAVTTSKAHDLKRAVQTNSDIDDWIYALISFHTQTHYGGRGWYGAARGPQGFLNRVFMALAPLKNARYIDKSQHFKNDVRDCLTHFGEQDTAPFASDPRAGITWLSHLDESDAIEISQLHPYFIEANRLCRLIYLNGSICSVKKARDKPRVISKHVRDSNPPISAIVTDPWTAIRSDTGDHLKLSFYQSTPDYKYVSDILDRSKYKLPICGSVETSDISYGALVVSGIARDDRPGRGNSLGYHERVVPVPKPIKSILARHEGRDEVAVKARERVKALGELRGALRFGLMVLAQGGPDQVVSNKPTTNSFIEPWLKRFEAEVDRDFFPDLWHELEQETAKARETAYLAWRRQRRDHAERLLDDAAVSLPLPVARRYRAQVKAESAFHGSLRKSNAFKETYDTASEEAA